jgi:hypothetical protein
MSREPVELPLAQLASLADEIRGAVRDTLRDELARVLAEVARPAAREDGLLSVDEAARRIGLSKSTTYKLAERCELPNLGRGCCSAPRISMPMQKLGVDRQTGSARK